MRFSQALIPAVLIAANLTSAAKAQTHPPKPKPGFAATRADWILINGVILTGRFLSTDNPEIVSAMAIQNGRVEAVGSNADIQALAGVNTRLTNLDSAHTGVFVMPGLNDAHTHLGGAGQTKLNVDLTGSQSLAEMLQRIQAKARSEPSRPLAHRRRLGPHTMGQ